MFTPSLLQTVSKVTDPSELLEVMIKVHTFAFLFMKSLIFGYQLVLIYGF